MLYTCPSNPAFETVSGVAKVLAPNIVLSYVEQGDWAFRVLEEEISEEQKSVEIDLCNCVSVFFTMESTTGLEVNAEFLSKANFLEVIEALAGKKKMPSDAGTSTSK
ncbi:hypothetical protein [Niallia sp. MER 6]|uniref:hypothetical protein n=1 Tax=Niallia sp. MER 6 TaxID=2939567 RepID=UPI00203EAE87|nr:hypothetical protein [Niallia sp. MER 6]MCM3032826.1 hypothetical protein [Niallia sp. MER 6]